MDLTFGKKLRLLREQRELNQTELGTAVHMTQWKISYLESGTYEPGMDDLKSLCSYFHVSADYFWGFQKNLPFSHKTDIGYPKSGYPMSVFAFIPFLLLYPDR